jgi:hypothetical protein
VSSATAEDTESEGQAEQEDTLNTYSPAAH